MAIFTDDELELLKDNIKKRQTVLATFFEKKEIPNDKDSVTSMAKLLDGIDKSILGVAKVRVDSEGAKSQKQFAATMAELLKKTPIKGPILDHPPELDDSIQVPAPVLGELDENPEPLNYEAFQSLSGT